MRRPEQPFGVTYATVRGSTSGTASALETRLRPHATSIVVYDDKDYGNVISSALNICSESSTRPVGDQILRALIPLVYLFYDRTAFEKMVAEGLQSKTR